MNDPILEAKLALNDRSQQLASKYSQDLRQAGFKLVKVTPRGVYFKGNLASFEKTFQTKIQNNQFTTEPIMPDFVDRKTASVYIPTKPIQLP